MGAITPVPTSRVSSMLFGQRLLTQLQSDQVDLIRIQSQISTGRRIVLPSEDAPAAVRAMGLQSLIERKTQVQTGLKTSQSYLDATDTALSSVSDLLAQARGTALSVADSTTSDIQRQTAASDIDRAIQQLVTSANQQFRGRYLFAGSTTNVQPFTYDGKYVRYTGNDTELQSYSDIDSLVSTNISGNQTFGAISAAVQGTADLNPTLSASTKLADLHGGQGVSLGSVTISDGVNSRTVDLSRAETVGDVAEILQANPPTGRRVLVSIGANGLNVELDPTGGGNLTIGEAGGGTTAAELGILNTTGVGTGPLVGDDVNRRVTLTTPLSDVLGVRASTEVNSTGLNNDLAIQANRRGAAFNGLAVTFVDNGTVTAGSEVVTYNAAAKTVQVNIQSGFTTANQVLAALNGDAAFSADYTTSLNPRDLSNTGDGTVTLAAAGTSAGGSGIEPDLTSGLQINNGGQTYTLDLSSAKTVEDLLNLLNGSSASVLAQINADGTGIDVRSRLSGADFSIGENGGSTATDLGIRSFSRATRLDSLNGGLGVHAADGADFSIQRKDGVKFDVDVSGAQTIGDVLDLINNDANNQDPAHKVTAQLATNGNGIELVTSDVSNIANLTVLKINNNQAAEDLGLTRVGQSTSDPPVVNGSTQTITGRDVNPHTVGGVFDALIRIRDSLQTNNTVQLTQAMTMLDDGATQVNFARAEIGARQNSLDTVQQRLDSEIIGLKSNLSGEIDTDLTSAISELVARQTAFQASLQVAGQLAQNSLLNYL